MNIRRVVTGHDANRKSVVISDGVPPRSRTFVHTPGFASAMVWSSGPGATVPHRGGDPTPGVKSHHPEPGGTRFLVVTFPPDAVMTEPGFNLPAAIQEHLEDSPGIADRFEPGCPGMHTTDTIDYGVVLDGEIWLELDDGNTVHLKQHDVFVQNGTRHAWRNKGSRPATLAVVLIGARRTCQEKEAGA
jgi:hypothetical protein